MEWLHQTRAAWRIRKSPWRAALEDLPPQLASHWRDSAPLEFHGIRTDAFFFARAAEGLMQFFDAAARSRTPCALPSVAADSVWHAWLRMDPIGLERFCRKHFGAVVPHLERAHLGGGAVLNTLAHCARRGGHAWKTGKEPLPPLFALDRDLRMPGGHAYVMRNGTVFHAPIDPHSGVIGAPNPHPELSRHALYGAGLLGGATYFAIESELARREARRQNADGGSGDVSFAFDSGSSSSSSSSCSDSGGGSGDSCSGSSCGSSCGGCGGD